MTDGRKMAKAAERGTEAGNVRAEEVGGGGSELLCPFPLILISHVRRGDIKKVK